MICSLNYFRVHASQFGVLEQVAKKYIEIKIMREGLRFFCRFQKGVGRPHIINQNSISFKKFFYTSKCVNSSTAAEFKRYINLSNSTLK